MIVVDFYTTTRFAKVPTSQVLVRKSLAQSGSWSHWLEKNPVVEKIMFIFNHALQLIDLD
jgi:hypothetical protein